MRWNIKVPKRSIISTQMEGHSDNLEMCGERASGIIGYSVRDGKVLYERDFVFPMFRIQPNDTHGSYSVTVTDDPISFADSEQFVSVTIDGTLTVKSRIYNAAVKRIFYPSVNLAAFYERIEITADQTVCLQWDVFARLDTRLGCEGVIYAERYADKAPCIIAAGDTFAVTFKYIARFANGEVPFETDALANRVSRISQLIEECDFTTGDDVIDTMFSFAKIRSGESLFRTRKGLVHCPCGHAYYAAVWCNDQCEYAAPWFAYTNDEKCLEASRNAFSWFEPFMGDDYKTIPSSIIAEGLDNHGCAGDRGDVAMYLYGLSRYYLILGALPMEKESTVDWCVEYLRRKITDCGVVFSDSDELENRISSGVNLSTSSLAYGGLTNVAVLYRRLGHLDKAVDALSLADTICNGIENYFGADIDHFKTYRYHKGCNVVRAWNTLPLYMGIVNRVDDTIRSIEDRLWIEVGCRSTEGENITWDRSALYFISTLFRIGRADDGWDKLKRYSLERLLGDRVPYAVEAYPEGSMRHLSAESALYCRIITDGLLNIRYDEKGFTVDCKLPQKMRDFTLRRIFINGKLRDITVADGKAQVSDSI